MKNVNKSLLTILLCLQCGCVSSLLHPPVRQSDFLPPDSPSLPPQKQNFAAFKNYVTLRSPSDNSGIDNAGVYYNPQIDYSQITKSKSNSAISNSSHSPVAASVAKMVYILYAVGICCLLASAALFYFGMIIPGSKCLLAGFFLPIAATWLNYHYAAVIAAVLIGSALGFLWAFAKHNKEKIAYAEKYAETEIAKLKAKL